MEERNEPQTELILNVKAQMQKELQMDIDLEELVENGPVYAELGAGYTEKAYIRGPGIYVHPVLFIYKGRNEKHCLNVLSKICNFYKKNRKVPKGETYSGRGLQVAAEPNKIGRQEDGQVLYSCIINYKISY